MRCIGYLTFALLAAASFAGGSAFANVCETGKLTCATTMPIDGYCECTAHGVTEDGTVVARPSSSQRVNATAGGCGAHPTAPGCKLSPAR
jgi:hypothetical protein